MENIYRLAEAAVPEKDTETENETSCTFGELTSEQEHQLTESIQALSSRNLLQQKCLKMMNGDVGGAFYVRYLQDDTTKTGWLQLVIEYPDGTCMAVL